MKKAFGWLFTTYQPTLLGFSSNLQNRASITTFPSILNVDHLTSLIRPRYEEMVALLDSVVLPNNDSDSRQEDHLDANVEHDAEGDYDSLKAFGCGQPLLCADEEEME